MKVLLLFPNSPIISEPCCEGYNVSKIVPYELATVATALRADHNVVVVDAKAESLSIVEISDKIVGAKPDFIILWSTPLTYLSDIKWLKFAKNIDIKTVLVLNPPILLEQILERFSFIDFTIKNDRPFAIKNLLKDSENAEGVYCFKERIDFAHPNASFDLLPMEKYDKTNVAIKTSTGCPFSCTFCSWGKSKWRTNSIKDILDEIEILVEDYGAKSIGFSEQNFTLNRKRVFDFCEGVKERGLDFNFFCDSRVDGVDKELLIEMKEAGLSRIFYGVEHVNNKILENVKKQQTKEEIEYVISGTKEVNIPFVLPFIIGLPGETNETLLELKNFIVKTKPFNYHIIFPVPFPGTELYEQAKENNWLQVEEKPENFWMSSNFYKPLMVVPPMTEKKLIKARKKLIFEPRLHPSIFLNTVRDVYGRGGLTKVKQVVDNGFRILGVR